MGAGLIGLRFRLTRYKVLKFVAMKVVRVVAVWNEVLLIALFLVPFRLDEIIVREIDKRKIAVRRDWCALMEIITKARIAF